MANRYDLLAPTYDQVWARYNQSTSDEVLRVFPDIPANARVLDVGAGTGYFLRQLLQKYPQIDEVVAFDSSHEMLRQAQTKRPTSSTRYSHALWSFVQGDAENLPFRDNSFDVVISMNTLHYLREPAKFFAEAYRVLDVGGTLIVQDYTRNVWPFFETAMRAFDGGIQRLYTPRDLNELAQAADFWLQSARYFRISQFWRGVLLKARKD